MFADVVRELKATEQQLIGQLEGVRAAIAALDERNSVTSSDGLVVRRRRRLSAKGRAAISRAQKLRWARQKAAK